jgi:hypothetical protein
LEAPVRHVAAGADDSSHLPESMQALSAGPEAVGVAS